jgi:DNA topoisomerase-1
VVNDRLELTFKGKSGKRHKISLQDRRLARIVKKCQDLPGQALFEYLDSDGNLHAVGSSDVNAYLREISGEEITAKDFRTWTATVLAAMALEEMEEVDSQAASKKNVLRAIEHVAERLGNTPAVCRKSYIHPAVLEAYTEGSLPAIVKNTALEEVSEELSEDLSRLPPEEAAVLAFLKKRLEQS